jgi:hypothetical protein
MKLYLKYFSMAENPAGLAENTAGPAENPADLAENTAGPAEDKKPLVVGMQLRAFIIWNITVTG